MMMDSTTVANKSAGNNGDVSKKGDSKDENMKRVKESRKIHPRSQPPRKPENPAKIKVRKEDVYCHVGTCVVCLVLYLVSVYYSSHKQIEMKPSILSEIEESLRKDPFDTFVQPQLPINQNIKITNNIGGDDETTCSLYIADSSVPSSGFGIFSMKSVKAGSELIPGGAVMQIGGLELSPYVMIIKHHPSFYNVNGGIGGSAIIATKDIEEGEEIFFNLEEYPTAFQTVYHKANPSHPTEMLFGKVDDITKKMIDAIPVKLVTIKPKRKQYKQKSKPQYAKRPAIDASPIFEVVKETLYEYDSALADLLPDSHNEALSIIEAGGRSEYISNKRSSLWLSKGGLCVDGVRPLLDISTHEETNGAMTSRRVKKGDIVISSPIYATTVDEGNKNCFLINEGGLTLCPLSFSSNINNGVPTSQCDLGTSKKCPNNMANAFYQWSEFNEVNKNIQDTSISELLEKPLTGFTIDVIALRDLDEDEEVFIDYSSGGEEGVSRLHLRKDMIPDAWK